MFFDDAGLFVLQISICTDNLWDEPESNPGAETTEDKSTTGLSNRTQHSHVAIS